MSALAAGFAEPVTDAQAVFRATMNAMARPGELMPIAPLASAPAPLSPGMAALVLALADYETPLWLDGPLAADPAVANFLRFHTGAPPAADMKGAAFALVSDIATLPAFTSFACGTPEYPDRSTTLLVAVSGFDGERKLHLAGPGIAGTRRFAPEGLPTDFPARWAANRALFPCGVDLVFVAGDQIAALPRSTRVVLAE